MKILAVVLFLFVTVMTIFAKDPKQSTPAAPQAEAAEEGKDLKFSALEQVALDDYILRQRTWYDRRQAWEKQKQDYDSQFNKEQVILAQQEGVLNKAFLDARHLSDKEWHYDFTTRRLQHLTKPTVSGGQK